MLVTSMSQVLRMVKHLAQKNLDMVLKKLVLKNHQTTSKAFSVVVDNRT